MAKDDYYVLVAKILVFLYGKLKGRETRDPIKYLQPNTKNFPISPDYFDYVIKHMYKAGYLEGMAVQTLQDGEPIAVYITENTQITPTGIDYLEENSKIKRILKVIPEAAGIVDLFV